MLPGDGPRDSEQQPLGAPRPNPLAAAASRAWRSALSSAMAAASLPRRLIYPLTHAVGLTLSSVLWVALKALAAFERFSVKRWYVTRLMLPFLGVYLTFHYYRVNRPAPLSPLSVLTLADCARENVSLATRLGRSHAAERSLRDAVLAAARGGKRLVVTVSNTTSAALAANWVAALGELRPRAPPMFVAAGDVPEAARLAAAGVPSLLLEDGGAALAHAVGVPTSVGHTPRSAATAAKIAWTGDALRKWATASAALAAGLDVLVTDVDTVVLRHPVGYIDTLPECDAYLTTDSTSLYGGSDIWYPARPRSTGGTLWGAIFGSSELRNYVSAGFAYLRATDRSRHLVDAVLRVTAAVARDATGAAAVQEYGAIRPAPQQPPPPPKRQPARQPAPPAPEVFEKPIASVGRVAVPVPEMVDVVEEDEDEAEEESAYEGNRRRRLASSPSSDAAAPAPLRPLDSEEAVLNAVLQRLYEVDEGGSNPVPVRVGGLRPSCAHYGSFSFLVLSPYLFQGAGHLHLTDVIHEPPFSRHFNHRVPPPPGQSGGGGKPGPGGPAGGGGASDGDGRATTPEVSLPERIAYMKDHASWLVAPAEERRLMCRGVLQRAAAAADAAKLGGGR